ncbi:MAG: RHS repeat-associated core domain-containing protein, partial [Candidatus Kryptoniota bacterium]
GLGNVVGEYNASGSLIARYVHGIGLESRITQEGSPDYYTFDAMGNTSELIGSGGVVQNSYAYSPFGGFLLDASTVNNQFAFNGMFGIINDGNGLYHIRARHYLPDIGRFIQSDPIESIGGIDAYSYVLNNPIELIDPMGLSPVPPANFLLNLNIPGMGPGPYSTTGTQWLYNIFTESQLFHGARAKEQIVRKVAERGVWAYGKWFTNAEKARKFAAMQRFSATVRAKK